MPSYHVELTVNRYECSNKCYMCGSESEVIIEATYPDYQTGHIDETELCWPCFIDLSEKSEKYRN